MDTNNNLLRSQVTLTPNESKRLIAKALIKTKIFNSAFKNGKIVIHPSSTTYFILKELNIKLPDDIWVCGIITPDGAFREEKSINKSSTSKGPYGFIHSWVLQKGVLQKKKSLKDILEDMGPGDIYIKGANALDFNKVPAVLIGNKYCGTISRVIYYSKKKNFKIIVPIGLEKIIPCSVSEASREAKIRKINFSMGMPCSLLAIRNAYVITEIEAINILSEAHAIPIASGGLCGAEGAITIIIKGNNNQINSINTCIDGIKGAVLPEIVYKTQ